MARNKKRRPLIPAALVAELAIQRLAADGYRSPTFQELAADQLQVIGVRLLDRAATQRAILADLVAGGVAVKKSSFNRLAHRLGTEANAVLSDLTRGIGADLARRVIA